VEALLVGNPVAGKPVTHVSNVNQDALAGLTKGDNSERLPAILWLLAALAVWFVTWLASHRLKLRRARAKAAAAAASAGTVGDGFGFDDPTMVGSGPPLAGTTATATLAPPSPPSARPPVAAPPSAASWWLRWTPYLIGFPIFIVCLYASFEAFSKVLPGAF
jgi:hypothetical protein